MSATATAVNYAFPDDARAVLLSRRSDGSISSEVVDASSDVLNIERDLCKHMMEYPHTDEWLRQVRDAIDLQLASRREARSTGRLSVPTKDGMGWQLLEIHPAGAAEKGEI